MRLGEILLKRELITAEAIAEALERQKTSGGRLGANLIALGYLTEEQLSSVIHGAPAAPNGVSATGISSRDLLSLLLKFMSIEGCETVLDLANRIKLPRLVVQQLLDEAAQQKLVQAMGASSSLGLSIRYALSEMGRNAAKEALDQNLYVGPAPVSLSAYTEQIAIQRMSNELLDADTLRQGFEGLVVPENYLRKLLPAVRAGRSLLLFGPPGFLIDDFGRQKFRPDDLLNRWIVPMESKIDYLQLHTGASFPLPFDILLIFSTNLQPDDLMDAAFLRRIRYKVKLHSPTSDEYRKIFEAVAKSHGLALTDAIFEFVLDNLSGKFDPAYYKSGFICEQFLEACKAFNQRPQLGKEMVAEALTNLYFDFQEAQDSKPVGFGS